MANDAGLGTADSIRLDAAGALALGAVGACLLAPGLLVLGDASPSELAGGMAAALAAYGTVALAVLAGLGPVGRRRSFGLPNALTLARAVLLAGLAGVSIPGLSTPTLAWAVCGLAVLALVLDGLDGWAARRIGPSTRFGALFDQEVDAATLLALATILAVSGKVGPWVLAIGAWRYAFLAATRIWPVLRHPLRPRWSRKVVCVVQGGVLAGCVAPVVSSGLAAPAAAGALALLSWSFLRDVRDLLAHRPAT